MARHKILPVSFLWFECMHSQYFPHNEVCLRRTTGKRGRCAARANREGGGRVAVVGLAEMSAATPMAFGLALIIIGVDRHFCAFMSHTLFCVVKYKCCTNLYGVSH